MVPVLFSNAECSRGTDFFFFFAFWEPRCLVRYNTNRHFGCNINRRFVFSSSCCSHIVITLTRLLYLLTLTKGIFKKNRGLMRSTPHLFPPPGTAPARSCPLHKPHRVQTARQHQRARSLWHTEIERLQYLSSALNKSITTTEKVSKTFWRHTEASEVHCSTVL